MAKISVLPVPAGAYNPDRVASDLVKTQIKQLQTAIVACVDTEGEAARCIKVLTKLLHEVRPRLTPTPFGVSKTVKRRRVRPARKTSPKRTNASKARR